MVRNSRNCNFISTDKPIIIRNFTLSYRLSLNRIGRKEAQ